MSQRARVFHRHLLCGAAIISLTIGATAAHAAERARYNIPPQALDSALRDFGAQSGVTLLVDTQLTGGKRSRGFAASADPETALRTLLAGTGLQYKREGDVFVVRPSLAANRQPILIRTAAVTTVAAAPADSAPTSVDELIVTAQKKEERIQDVPIAISAFSGKALEEQKIEGGPDLLKAIPNVTFSKNNFSGVNFSIRGVGTKAVSVTTDPAVAISFNNTPVIRNRLFEQEYYDIDRVEVLRGPQGTLYGRNATAGVVNVITAKPTDIFEGMIKGEVGNHNTRRLSGFVNVPLGDTLALRVAGASTQRDGFDFNTITDNKVNGRDLWSGRISLEWKPTDNFSANFVWEHFDESDNRSRTGKQLCHRDPGPSSVQGFGNITDDRFPSYTGVNAEQVKGILSQGCLPGSLFNADAFGTPNGNSLPLVIAGQGVVQLGLDPNDLNRIVPLLQQGVDPYGGAMQSTNLREIASQFDPIYRAKNDTFQLNLDFDITPDLKLSSQTLYSKDDYYSSQDYNRFNTSPVFNDSSGLIDPSTNQPSTRSITPGGIFCDPQLGCSSSIVGLDISQARSKQWSQEIRLQSAFSGPINFSLGANYLRYETAEDYYVLFNVATAIAQQFLNSQFPGTCQPGQTLPGTNDQCLYIDPNKASNINGQGHNYFRSSNPYKVESSAIFGEVYWNVAENVKITGGLRYTDDRKSFTQVPSQLLLAPNGVIGGGVVNSGYPTIEELDRAYCALKGTLPENCVVRQSDIKQRWGEVTGRLGVDWKPELSFTDQTMVYAFYSRGYKGGGANPPQIGSDPSILQYAANPSTFRPEFVNAFEIGTKNSFLGGSLILNGSAFYYDYKDYQVSKIVDRTALNENFDARVWGLELESVWQPTRNFRMNANIGYLNTKLGKGSKSIDLMDRTQGDPNYMVVKPWVQLSSNCVVPTAVVAQVLNSFFPGTLGNLCGGGGLLGDFRKGGLLNTFTGIEYDPSLQPNGGQGFFADVSGNDLPNSPHMTFNIGAQYSMDLPENWRATVRADYYYQAKSFARVYNTEYDRLKAWDNTNISLVVANPDKGLTFEVYVKNVFDKTPVTDSFTNSDDTGLTTNVFTLDPRLVGLSVRKTF